MANLQIHCGVVALVDRIAHLSGGGAVTDRCTAGMRATNPLYYNATPAKVESIKLSPIDKATSDTASFQYTVVFEEGAALKEQSGHVVVKKENGKWCVSGFSVKSNEKAE